MNSNSFQLPMADESKYNQLITQIGTLFPEKVRQGFISFFTSYEATLKKEEIEFPPLLPLFETFLTLVIKQLKAPAFFELYHGQITTPFDYHHFGLEFIRPLIDLKHSTLTGEETLQQITSYLTKKDNVILFSNHQSEADPQIIKILLEQRHPMLSKQMIFVAGERVITDPLAVPFSLGLNLLCIYSKRYIDHPPEDKSKKQLHNKRTMETMSKLLKEGGKCIWVAPSGGRDRPTKEGIFEVASFDPQSIEMFALMAQKADHPTHFFPLAIKAHTLLPPPNTVQIELGEARFVERGDVHLAFGPEINMDTLFTERDSDRQTRKKLRAEHICDIVKKMYTQFSPDNM